jgi:hypothetical protein
VRRSGAHRAAISSDLGVFTLITRTEATYTSNDGGEASLARLRRPKPDRGKL